MPWWGWFALGFSAGIVASVIWWTILYTAFMSKGN